MEKIELGQIFTKKLICDFMVELLSLNKGSVVLEPCAGEGVFIDSLIEQNKYRIKANELDENYYNKLKIKFNNIDVSNKEFLLANFKTKYDAIIMNPPFIRHEEINNLNEFGITKKDLHEVNIYKNLSLKSNIYMYFILKAISILNTEGELIVVFPSAWLNSDIGTAFKKEIENQTNIEEIINIVGNPYEDNVIVDSIIMKCKKNSNKKLKIRELIIKGNSIEIKDKKHRDIELSNGIEFHNYAKIRRGLGTGYNRGFINPKINNEKDFNKLPDILSSPKQLKGYNTSNAKTDKLLSLDNKTELNISSSILNYKKQLKQDILKNMEPKTIYEKILTNKEWDKINVFNGTGIIFGYIIRENCKFVLNNKIKLVRDNFYIIDPKINVYIMMALLNNYYIYIQLERIGKKYGQGMLKIQVKDFDKLKLPDLTKIKKQDIRRLKMLGKDILEKLILN